MPSLTDFQRPCYGSASRLLFNRQTLRFDVLSEIVFVLLNVVSGKTNPENDVADAIPGEQLFFRLSVLGQVTSQTKTTDSDVSAM